MKNLFITSILGAFVLFSGCKKKDDDSPTSSYSINYKNQNLQGKIDGQDWTYKTGNASSNNFSAPDINHRFEITDSLSSDSCFLSWDRVILFSFDDKNEFLTTGAKTLSFDLSKTINYTVTFYYNKDNISHNIIAAQGGYEILSVDTTLKLVAGRMDAYGDKDNFANGNFILKYCD